MDPNNARVFGEPAQERKEEDTLKLPAIEASSAPWKPHMKTGIMEQKNVQIPDTPVPMDGQIESEQAWPDAMIWPGFHQEPGRGGNTSTTAETPQLDFFERQPQPPVRARMEHPENVDTHQLPGISPEMKEPVKQNGAPKTTGLLPRGRALFLVALLAILLLNGISAGYAQFVGPQGWAYVLNGPSNTNNTNILSQISNSLKKHPTPGATAQPTPQLTPQQYINLIVQHMSLDEKLGQMMIIQFTGPQYSLDLSEMISQYDVGAVLLFPANSNIVSKSQLTNLDQQMQQNAHGGIPLIISVDQEGGTVDRLVKLDGPRQSATAIGETNNPNRARDEGIQDSKDLARYGINLNLAPVVDVTNVYNSQMYLRTFGTTPSQVTRMAEAYLQGLQQSGKVIGALKHFPGLGDVSTDPHTGLPILKRTKSQLESIDWAPYRAMIAQGNVHAIMVTHEIVNAIDSSQLSSLSHKVITGVLRDDLGFQGVIMTDSLTMDAVTSRVPPDQATMLAIQAGADLLMGAGDVRTLAEMITALKQAVSSGQISQQRIDDSVRRILMLKYQMGLLTIPAN